MEPPLSNPLTALSTGQATDQPSTSTTDQPTGPPTNLTFENFPIEIYHYHIFKFLNIEDVLQLKLVSKAVYKIGNSLNVQELLFQSRRYKDCWISLQPNRPVHFNNIISDLKLSLLWKLPIFLNLKRLQIDPRERSIKLDDFNKFTKLQILEINLVEEHPSHNHHLQLPELKALALGIYQIESKMRDKFVIDAPNLQHLVLHSWKTIQLDDLVTFVHPLSVNTLRIQDFDKRLSTFKNLECLEYSNVEGIVMDDLLKLDNLKLLRILNGPICNKLDVIRKLHFYKPKMKISLKGVLLETIDKLEEYKKLDDHLKFQLANYHCLEDDLNFEQNVQYDKLISLLPKEQPIDLFSKFSNIKELTIGPATSDEQQIVNFIKECQNLGSLDVANSKLGQEFFDHLPMISTLFHLNIKECATADLNFEFIMRMYYLVSLCTELKITVDDRLNLNKIKFFEKLEYKIKGDLITIYKEDTDKYWENLDSDYMSMFNPYKKEITFARLVEWCEFVESAKQKPGIICPSVKFHKKKSS